MPNKLAQFFLHCKNLFGRFGENPQGHFEYYLKLDGTYYCKKTKKLMVIVRVRHKRTVDILSVQELIHDKEYLRELHPMDACILGILAHKERNHLLETEKMGGVVRFKEMNCFIKTEPVLLVAKKYRNDDDVEMTVLRSKYLDLEIEIPTPMLCQNPALLYALDAAEATSVGYSASESMIG